MYCLKCKENTSTLNMIEAMSSNGIPMHRGTCAICGCGKSQFIKRTGGMLPGGPRNPGGSPPRAVPPQPKKAPPPMVPGIPMPDFTKKAPPQMIPQPEPPKLAKKPPKQPAKQLPGGLQPRKLFGDGIKQVPKLSEAQSKKRVAKLKKQGYAVKTVQTPNGDLVLKRPKSHVQSVVFRKEQFTLPKARKWLKAHGYHEDFGVDKKKTVIRFRQIDPSKFKGYAVKELPNGVYLVLGFKKVTGEGIYDTIKKAYKFIKSKFQLRTNIPPDARAVLEKFGNQTVKSAYVCRKKLNEILNKLIHFAAPKLKYDDLFHLSIHFELENTHVRVEKNEVVAIYEDHNYKTDPSMECRKVENVEGKTLNEIIQKTESRMGSTRFSQYHPTLNNCQIFLREMLMANNLNIPDRDAFILQDVTNQISPRVVSVAKKITDLANIINKKIKGNGLGDAGFNEAMTDGEIAKELADIKGFRGVVSQDAIESLPKGSAYVLNLDKKYENNGTHWCAVMNYGPQCFYFDPFGFPPDDNILKVMQKTKKQCIFNNADLQRLEDSNCGRWCIHIIKAVSGGAKPYDVLYEFDQEPTADNFNKLQALSN